MQHAKWKKPDSKAPYYIITFILHSGEKPPQNKANPPSQNCKDRDLQKDISLLTYGVLTTEGPKGIFCAGRTVVYLNCGGCCMTELFHWNL